jgi:HSP20 family protein
MIVVRRGRPRDRVRRSTEMDEMFRALMSPRGAVSTRSTGTWRPSIDVYEKPDSIMIVAEIAGMDRDEIEIVIEGDIVSLRGTRPDPNVCDQRSFHEAHIPYGSFAADVYVPFAIDNDLASATYENGFLRIELPRVQGRTIVPTAPEPRATSERSDA